MKTVTLPLDKLIAYAGNPRKNDHAVEAVASAIKRFGFRVPVLAKSDGSLIDGHLRVKAAKHLGMKEVPVVLCDDLSEADIKALRISINRMAELAEWDTELLSAELEGLAAEGIGLEDVGFDADYLGELGADLGLLKGNPEADAEPQIDKAEELRAKWGVEPGQLWELGDHRLLCGDSTKKEDAERVMGGEKAQAIWTDPPYGVDHIGGTKDPRRPTHRSGGVVHNDQCVGDKLVDLISSAIALIPKEEDAVCYMASPANSNVRDFIDAFNASGFQFKHTLVWVKSAFVFGRADYHYKHELVLYGWAKSHEWVGPRNLSTVFDFPRGDKTIEHPTSKPVGLIVGTLGNHPGKIVAEPFSGSGTTIIACEQLGRKCRAIEISPAYVAVALQRWADATGKTPRLVP
jgi:DNA modification methylase